MEKTILSLMSLLLTIGVVIALIIFGYTLGHEIGSALGQDITNINSSENLSLDN